MTDVVEYNIVIPKEGYVGKIVEITVKPDTILIFQVPMPTKEMSKEYREKAFKSLKSIIPENAQALMIGSDVSIYEIAGEDAVALRLKGEI